MDTLRSLGGWLVSALCLPTIVVLLSQGRDKPASAPPVPAPVGNTTPTPSPTVAPFSPSQWFRSVPGLPASGWSHLRGVHTVSVVCEVSGDRKEFSASEVKTKVEFKLRQAGLKVIAPDSGTPDAVLSLSVSTLNISGSVAAVVHLSAFAARSAVTFNEDEFTKAVAVVWLGDKCGYAGTLRVREFGLSDLETLTEEFTNAVAAANGK